MRSSAYSNYYTTLKRHIKENIKYNVESMTEDEACSYTSHSPYRSKCHQIKFCRPVNPSNRGLKFMKYLSRLLGADMTMTPKQGKRTFKPKMKKFDKSLSVVRVQSKATTPETVLQGEDTPTLPVSKDEPTFVHQYLNVSDNLNLTNVNFARSNALKMKAAIKQNKIQKKEVQRREENLSGWELDSKTDTDSLTLFEN